MDEQQTDRHTWLVRPSGSRGSLGCATSPLCPLSAPCLGFLVCGKSPACLLCRKYREVWGRHLVNWVLTAGRVVNWVLHSGEGCKLGADSGEGPL